MPRRALQVVCVWIQERPVVGVLEGVFSACLREGNYGVS